jgi:predicted  nucleic acid-binding Zn-ribbon protein
LTIPNDKAVQWCTTCGARFTEEEVAGANCCPRCGCKGTPCSTERDYLLEINWHELRILGIWASNWAEQCDDAGKQALRGILTRLEQQVPGAPPLTLGGEIRLIRESGLAQEVETNIPREGFAVVHGPGAVGFCKPPRRGDRG